MMGSFHLLVDSLHIDDETHRVISEGKATGLFSILPSGIVSRRMATSSFTVNPFCIVYKLNGYQLNSYAIPLLYPVQENWLPVYCIDVQPLLYHVYKD